MASAQQNCIKSSRRCGKTRRKRIYCDPSRPISCSHDDSLKLIRIWMKKEFGFKNKLVPAVFPTTGRGLMTRKSIRPGEILVSLPQRLLITTQTVLDSDIGKHIKRWKPKLTPQQCLTVFLIWEKHKHTESPWFPYINMLPVTFTSPGYFSSTELSFLPKCVRLKVDEVLEKLDCSYREVKHYSKYHWTELYDILTYDLYIWSWYVINSRSVYYQSNHSKYLSTDEPDNIALAPYLDLLNHSSQANVKAGYNAITNCYEIITYDVYKPYQEVFISYGCHGNQKLFIEYGFYIPDNCNDVYEISYDDILNACEHFSVKYKEKKLDLLKHHDLLKNLVCTMDGLSWKAMTVFKTLAMEWRHLEKWSQIYTETDIFNDLLPIVNTMIVFILQPYLDDNIQLMKQLQIQV
ncbi:SET domain-containing protein 4 [Mactra antiquata]